MHVTTFYVNKLYLTDINKLNDHKNYNVAAPENTQHGRQAKNAAMVMSRRCPFGASAVIAVFKHNQHFREEMDLLALRCVCTAYCMYMYTLIFTAIRFHPAQYAVTPQCQILSSFKIDKIEIDDLLRKPQGMYA